MLFEINDRVAGARNDASWNDLFVKAIANFVMCASGYQAPTREEALRHENFLDRADADIGGFLARMASTGGREMLAAYRLSVDIDADWEARNQWNDACRRQAERIDNVEARWLAERIGKDGRLQENELALVQVHQADLAVDPSGTEAAARKSRLNRQTFASGWYDAAYMPPYQS